MSAIRYFGQKWDSPYLDDEPGHVVIHAPTPVGEKCCWCNEVIRHDERGLYRLVVLVVRGEDHASQEPIHVECDLRSGVGSPAHLRGQCSCRGVDEEPFPGTLREEALETLEIINQRRAAQGAEPFW